jgi:hypothetical protein
VTTTPLAPALGRLAAPPRGRIHDPIRLALGDRIVSSNAERPLDGGTWLAAWQAAATALRDKVIDEANRRIDAAAARSRYPAARLVAVKPDAEVAERLLNRLLAEGVTLERLDGRETDAASNRARGVALETAWGAAVRIADAELVHWNGVARAIEQWRRPWRPFVIVSSILLLVASLLAAMLGGVLPAPAWFAPINDWFWSLPWP